MKQGTAGIILINEYMPNDVKFDPNKPVDSKEFKKKMTEFAKKHPQLYAKNITHIAYIGEKMAFYLGANVGPNDLKVDDRKVSSFINSIDSKMKKAKTDDQKRNILLQGLSKATDLVQKVTPDSNEMKQQVKSGARGKPVQFARMAIGPIYSVDMSQKPKPILIRNSFTKGLSSNEYFNVASQGRFASVQSANTTSEPGALGKVLAANADDQTVTMIDCGTTNGIFMNTDDRHIIGRYEAGTNKLIDEDYFNYLKKHKKQVKVRSPITCQVPKGVCAKCYGLKSDGHLPAVGDNVGIVASQTVGQIMTQMVLSTKHSTIGKNDDDSLTGVEGFKIIANSPLSFTDAAVVSPVEGIVQGISPEKSGGHYVYIGTTKVHVPAGKRIIVKKGQSVHKGDKLSSGVVTPKQILYTQGTLEARKKESDMLHKLFKDSTGKDLQKKHFEVIARGHLSLGMADDGTVDSIHTLMSNYPRLSRMEMVGPRIKGKYLAEDVGSLSKGLQIDDRVMKLLNKWMIHRVKVTEERPPVKPLFKSLEQRPVFGRSLFSKLNYRNLSKAIKDEVATVKRPQLVGNSSSDREKHTAGYL